MLSFDGIKIIYLNIEVNFMEKIEKRDQCFYLIEKIEKGRNIWLQISQKQIIACTMIS